MKKKVKKTDWDSKKLGIWTLAKFITKDKDGKETKIISVVNENTSWMLNVSEDLLLYHMLDGAKEGYEDEPVLMLLSNMYYVSILPDAKFQGKVYNALVGFVEDIKKQESEKK